MTLSLFIGLGAGIGVLIILALLYHPRAVHEFWRDAAYAAAVGIALAALLDLLPLALEQLATLVGALPVQSSPLGFVGSVLSRLMTPIGVLGVLFLFFAASNAPVRGYGQPSGSGERGWRNWLAIPGRETVDWIGLVLLSAGLAAQNLWLSQMRSGLISGQENAATLFWFLIMFIATLRGIAQFAPLRDPLSRLVPFIAFVLVIGGGAWIGIVYPDSMGTLVLGVLPPILGAIVLPLAIGRSMRVIQEGVGLNWQMTSIIVVTFLFAFGAGMLLARAAQGRFL
jgi:hypothetical protein